VKAARSHLAAVFEAAALCVGAKLLEAAVMLEEGDHGGVVAMTGQASPLITLPVDQLAFPTQGSRRLRPTYHRPVSGGTYCGSALHRRSST